ncbi:hypothetical protein V6N13_022209 [Hibiscus sabdariffa]
MPSRREICGFTRFSDFIVPSGCGVPSLIVSSAPRPNLSVVWVVDRWVWMLLLVRNGHVSGEMVVCVGRLRASCIELSSRTTLQCPPLVAVEPKGCDRDPVLRTYIDGISDVLPSLVRQVTLWLLGGPQSCPVSRVCRST